MQTEDFNAVREALEPKIREYGIRAMAREVEIASPTIHQWFKGRSSLSVETVQAIAKVLGYSLSTRYVLLREKRK